MKEIIGTLNTLKNYPHVQPKKPGLIGFCMGGFPYTTASRYPDLGAIIPFYGAGYDPTPEEVAKVNAPVYAFYGSQDNSVPAEQRAKIGCTKKQAKVPM